MLRLSIATISVLFVSQFSAFSQSCHESGPEPHAMAPIGIMGGHTHSKGHLMASYRFMNMHMNGLQKNTKDVSSEDALGHYMMAPTKMNMQMHMIGVMYAPTDRITLTVMSSYRHVSMFMDSEASHADGIGMEHDHSTMGGMDDMNEPMELVTSSMQNHGLGDTKLGALIRLNKSPNHCIHSMVGMNVPTGSIDAGDEMHAIMPYSMQNGSGSVGAYLGLNYSWLTENYLVGTQVLSKAPLHENKRGYMSPVEHDASIWASRKWLPWVSTSLRIHGHYQTGIRGADVLINKFMSPAGNGANEALVYTDASAGINLKPFDQWRLGLEAGYMVYQYNYGLHMNNQWTATLGLQFIMH